MFQWFAHRKKKAMVEALEKVKAGEEEGTMGCHRWSMNLLTRNDMDADDVVQN